MTFHYCVHVPLPPCPPPPLTFTLSSTMLGPCLHSLKQVKLSFGCESNAGREQLKEVHQHLTEPGGRQRTICTQPLHPHVLRLPGAGTVPKSSLVAPIVLIAPIHTSHTVRGVAGTRRCGLPLRGSAIPVPTKLPLGGSSTEERFMLCHRSRGGSKCRGDKGVLGRSSSTCTAVLRRCTAILLLLKATIMPCSSTTVVEGLHALQLVLRCTAPGVL